MKHENYIRGRGAQLNPPNRYLAQSLTLYTDDLATDEERRELLTHNPRTRLVEVFPKTILNKVNSPDLGFSWSMNPYQGCEHGCIYCYARNTHEYWGYSAGKDFEQIILIKRNAPELLRKALLHKKWKPQVINLAGNTDIYQPAERSLKITRQCLMVFAELKHPVSLITKNALVLRDLDILAELAQQNLVWVTLSLTTLRQSVKSIMEPRTSSVRAVLRALEELSAADVPVNINMAPIIPAINDDEILELVKTVATRGAKQVSYIVVRLNGHNGMLFEDWLRKNFPDRADKVLNRIKSMHGGKVNDTMYGRRMKGEGEWATLIHRQMELARRRYLPPEGMPPLDFSLFEKARDSALNMKQSSTQPDLFSAHSENSF
ncbi:MAG: PA0069 family radical SAM protein [Chitinophagales bacterium]|nr:PA0069 family radical SAM protein [Chitinophagales bacterium]MDW8419685.1 PA0069 family radical SAM protein [Chitinophagales bacterium]